MEKLLEIYDRIDQKAKNCVKILEVMKTLPPRKSISEDTLSYKTGLSVEEVADCLQMMAKSKRVRKTTMKTVSVWEAVKK